VRKSIVRKLMLLVVTLAGLIHVARAGETVMHSRTPGATPYISERYIYQLDWEAEHIARVIAGQEFDFRGGPEMPDIAPKGDPGRVEIIDGKRCLVGGFFQFDVDDKYVFDTNETIVLNMLFDTSVNSSFVVTYDGYIGPKAKKHYVDPAVGRWQWVRLELDSARFADRRHGVDFGVATLASQMAGVEYEVEAMGTTDASSEDRISADPNIALCNLVIERGLANTEEPPLARFELELKDERGNSTAARVGLYRLTDGWSPKPGDSAIRMRLLGLEQEEFYLIDGQENWPGKGRYVFYVDGEYSNNVPVGRYQLVVTKGPEYRVIEEVVDVQPDKINRVSQEIKRWINMPERGWYSGDIHVHLERRDRGDDAWILKLADAEDVGVSSMLAESGWFVPHFFSNYAYGDERGGRVYDSEKTHIIVSSQESPVTQELGHAIGVNQDGPVRSEDYYIYKDYIEGIHEQGGLFGFSHVQYYPLLNVHRGMALEVPFGHVDFAEVLQAGVLGTKVWYDFLNMGFKVTPAAGTDFPFLNIWGNERTYVKLKDELTHQAWYDGLESGNVFVTSGPMLTFTVNKRTMGETIEIAQGESLLVKASAQVNPGFDEIDRLEIVVHGTVIASSDKLDRNGLVSIEHELVADESMWIAARAYGKNGNPTEAHSAPIYVHVDGEQFFGAREKLVETGSYYLEELNSILTTPPSWPDAETRQEFSEEELLQEYHDQLPRLTRRVEAAKALYLDLLFNYAPK